MLEFTATKFPAIGTRLVVANEGIGCAVSQTTRQERKD